MLTYQVVLEGISAKIQHILKTQYPTWQNTTKQTCPMVHWSLEPIFESYLLVGVVALALFGSLWVRPTSGELTARRQALLLGLRAAVILLVLLAMLGPTVVHSVSEPRRSTLVLLLDTSRSMQLPNESGGVSRWQTQRTLLEKAQPLLADFQENTDIKVFGYDASLHPLAWNADGIALPDLPTGQQTDLGGAIHAVVQRELGKRLTGIILLGDGAQTALAPNFEVHQAGRELERMQYPLYTVAFGPVGAEAESRDVAIENLQDQYSVFVKNELSLTAMLRARGYANQELLVQLVVEGETGAGEIVAEKRILAPDQGAQTPVHFQYAPPEAGQFKLTVRVAEQPGELVTKNNRLSAFLTVREGGIKVFYLFGDLTYEQEFLRRRLDQSPDIELDSRWIQKRLRSNWPVDLTDVFQDKQYDAFIIGDVDSSALYEKNGASKNLEALAEAVSRGKGLLLLGGRQSFGPGGYRHTPLADVIPVVMERFERQDIGAPLRTDLHLPGPLEMIPSAPHFVTRLKAGSANLDAWKALPPLLGANKFSAPKAAARVMLRSPRGYPLLVAGGYGQGRVLAFAGDSTWRWRMQGHLPEYQRFWRQAILWLTGREDDQTDNVWVRLARRRFQQGADAEFTAGAADADGTPLTDAQLDIQLLQPNGHLETIQPVAEDGHFAGRLEGLLNQPGEYVLQVSAQQESQMLGVASAKFEVFDQDIEWASPAANPSLLSRLANYTQDFGGKRVAPEELNDLLRELKRQPVPAETPRQIRWRIAGTPLGAWLVFLLLMALLALEWSLRKTWRLA